MGQRPFAPHHSLSQRTTSFIASCRQGIHQMPLGHLIALISNAHLPTPNSAASEKAAFPDGGLGQMNIVERPEFYRDKPNWSCGCKLAGPCGRRRRMSGVSGVSPPHDGNDHRLAFAEADSVLTSHADTIELGGARRDRTDDLKLAKLALSQLSYGPNPRHPTAHLPA